MDWFASVAARLAIAKSRPSIAVTKQGWPLAHLLSKSVDWLGQVQAPIIAGQPLSALVTCYPSLGRAAVSLQTTNQGKASLS